MSGLAELVEELTIETRAGDLRGDSLLQQLRAEIGSNLGRTKAGASSGSPVPLNVDAFALWEDITGQIASMFVSATDRRPDKDPEVNLLAWWAVFSAAVYRHETVQLQHDVAGERLESWAQRIRDHFAAPRTVEVMVPCPNCGYERIVLGEADQAEVFALVAVVKGTTVTVVCRNPVCKDAFGEPSQWVGERQLEELGRRVGVRVDHRALMTAVNSPVESTWDPSDDMKGDLAEPFNPADPAHAALLDTPTD